ncbi:MAG TPA: type III pantothenate kinase [Candidatus Saccharimonadia bacterium]|nr:type III pantothenate kinase [Candidatus Saccharimonadia bacterium]
MTRLLVDIGNSRLKWTRSSDAAPGPVVAHALDESLGDALPGAWVGEVDEVWIASVASPARTAEVVAVAARAWPRARIEVPATPAQACGVVNAYDEPGRLGIDRFLALVGACARHDGPVLVASLGTALAIDALARAGRHLGGLITPSPDTMRTAVLGSTARTAFRGTPDIADFGRSTEACLHSGTWLAAAALVDRAAARLAVIAQEPVSVLVAGGGAPTLSPLLGVAHELVPALVLEGLARFAQSAR